MLLILFLKVETEHTFLFRKIMMHTGKKRPKANSIAFSKSTLKNYEKYLEQNCYFMVESSLLRQKIGIPI